jgi:3'-phosphoadenosine 5'-phosphosulfate sulfotransferase (PAPS reductase)/FAD synthetase
MIHVISLGAGVQSSTMALMAARGLIKPMPDCAIFADTGAEPEAVYRHLDWLEDQLPFPVHRVSAGNLADEIMGAMAGPNRMESCRSSGRCASCWA